MNTGTKRPPRYPTSRKAFHVNAALTYAAEHVQGCNQEGVGMARSKEGNHAGAVRLCAWALAKHMGVRP